MDYRKLAIDELHRLGTLRTAETICRDRLHEMDSRMRSAKGVKLSAEPVIGSGANHTEEQWLNIIAAKTDEERRLRGVLRCLKRFDIAWSALDVQAQKVLTEFFIVGGFNCADRFASKEHCDRATAYRWRDEALISFSRAYFGAVVT